MLFKGKAWIFGDNVDTDVIIPARYLNTTDPKELANHCMEDIAPGFKEKIKPGDIIIAGKNFGCGSSREHAPIAIKSAGISCAVASSFARIFYRNSINIGLPIMECEEIVGKIKAGDEVEIDTDSGIIRNITQNTIFEARPFPGFIKDIIQAGGLMNYAKQGGQKNV